MSSGPGQPERESYAALAAQVADLRTIVTKWDARLQHAGLDGSIDLAAKLAELAGLLVDEAKATVAPYWLEYSDDEYRDALAELASWVWNVLVPNYDVPGIRACWAGHPAAVWELSTLAAEWRRIYDRKNPLLAAALVWNDRWLPGAYRRLAQTMKDCTAGKCAFTNRTRAG